MGLFSFVSNAAMYRGYAVGKMSLIAMFTGLPPVVVTILAYAVWGETLSPWQLSAFVLIMTGLMMVRYSSDLSLRNLQGAQWGVLTMLFFGMTDFLTKQATLIGAELFPTLVLMYITGGICFGLLYLSGRRKALQAARQLHEAEAQTAAAGADRLERGQLVAAVVADESLQEQCGDQAARTAAGPLQGQRGADGHHESQLAGLPPAADSPRLGSAAADAPGRPWSGRRTLLWGMTVGITNACGMMLAMPAFKLGVTGLVSAVMAANVVIVMLYARFALKEKFSRLEAGGLLLGFIGIVFLKLMS